MAREEIHRALFELEKLGLVEMTGDRRNGQPAEDEREALKELA